MVGTTLTVEISRNIFKKTTVSNAKFEGEVLVREIRGKIIKKVIYLPIVIFFFEFEDDEIGEVVVRFSMNQCVEVATGRLNNTLHLDFLF